MDRHVFLAVNLFFCAALIDQAQTNSSKLKRNSPTFFEIRDRVERDTQEDTAVVNTRGNFQITGGVNLPDIASNIRKGIHGLNNVLQSIANQNPISAEIITQFAQGQGNYGSGQVDISYRENGMSYERPFQGNQNGFRPPPGPPYGPPPGPPYGPPPPPHHGHHGHHGHHRPPPPPGHGHHGHYPPPPPPPPDQNFVQPPYGGGQNLGDYNGGRDRPDFSQQPYPNGNSQVNIDLSNQHGMSEETNQNTPTASTPYIFSDGPSEVPLKADPNDSKSKGQGNVSGYIENNFPVILLNENEIR